MSLPPSSYPDLSRYDTFPKLLAWNANHWPQEVAMREKEFGIWNEFTWADYQGAVERFAHGMRALQIGAGDVVAIIGGNRPEWVHAELAAHAIGAASIGIFEDSLRDEVAYLLKFANIKAIACEDEEQVDKVLEVADQCPRLQYIMYHDPRGMRKYDDPRLISQTQLMEWGEKARVADRGAYQRMIDRRHGDEVALLITTSGTTSHPKLAMMTSRSFLEHCLAYLRVDPKQPGENYVSVLPLPWVMDQIYVVAQPLLSRVVANFVEEQDTMMSDLREIGPHSVMFAPRVWESIASDINARIMDASPLKRCLFRLGMRWGMRSIEQRGKPSRPAYWLMFRALRDRLGFTNLRSAATAGAALAPETFKFFLAMGLPLRQLYGQTELAGCYTTHMPDDVDYDSVGVAFENTDIRIDQPDKQGVGEILARNSGMFVGYFNDSEATAATLKDGWMRTGDAGYINERNGHLVVIDRLKDLASTVTGIRFSPQHIENKLKFSPFIAEAVVLGHQRPYLTAIICIRYGILSKWAEQRGIAFTNYTNLAGQERVYGLIREEVARVNDSLPKGQNVRKFLLLYKELDPDDGELTRTRKIRRGVIREKYRDIINALYSDSDSVHVDTMITFQDGVTAHIRTDLVISDLGVERGTGQECAA